MPGSAPQFLIDGFKAARTLFNLPFSVLAFYIRTRLFIMPQRIQIIAIDG